MPLPSRRADVLCAASRRFFRDGITATGVDTVVADAGVAKMTLYSNFGSKDDLVAAYLEERDQRFLADLDAEVARQDDPLVRAMAPVTVYRRYLDEEGFHGCAFLNAAAEIPADHPARDLIRQHKQRMRSRWTDLIRELEADEPDTLALQCLLLLEGAFAHAGIGLGRELFDDAASMIRSHLVSAAGTMKEASASKGG